MYTVNLKHVCKFMCKNEIKKHQIIPKTTAITERDRLSRQRSIKLQNKLTKLR
jgi:hypothetical protein